MKCSVIGYVVNNISLPFNASFKEAFSVARRKLRAVGVNTDGLGLSVYRRSVDARKKNDIRFVYSIRASGDLPDIPAEQLSKHGISIDTCSAPEICFGRQRQNAPVVIVGSGPCGLFCALMLAENGYQTVLIERGGSVDERKKAIDRFKSERLLDTNTNIQFGAGGAGTFSDGKLVTRINSPLCGYILNKMIEFGAPADISFVAKPHVGTDVLSVVIDNVIRRIRDLGGTVLFNTTFLGYKMSGDKIVSAKTSLGDIACSDLVLAVGHSARDTYFSLIENGVNVEPKSFSVGMRIEHPTELIDRAMYGEHAGDPILGHAEYNLSYNTKVRGVYTFCMCPGGVVVAATSEQGGVVTNGMSYHARDGKNSNSAVCCTVFKEDYGSSATDAINFQRKIERAAFVAGGSDYSAPIITVGDFLSGELKHTPSNVLPSYMDGSGVKLSRPEEYLPLFITENIKSGLFDFDKKIKGFASLSAVLTGPETRTSSPVRIIRDITTGLATGFTNLYPAGEGAGYAGGITSAAIDGVRTALEIMKKYLPGIG